jgi:hypothetical protein
MAIGFSTDGNGETKRPVGSKVGVAAGAEERDCVQAEISMVNAIRTNTTSMLCCLLLIDSPL